MSDPVGSPLVGTHNGHFHADEALAVFLLRLLPTYKDSPLVRTRDPSVLEKCHTVVDVGGVYDASINRFDHHQREFQVTFPAHSTKLSSAGLVYMHFGKEIIARQTGLDIASDDVDVLYEKLYDDFVEAFDANDNGISAFDMKAVKSANLEKKFEDRGFSIASVVNRYNYHFAPTRLSNEAPQSAAEVTPVEAKGKEQLQAEEDGRFLTASAFCGQQFVLELSDKHLSWLPARTMVSAAYSSRQEYHPSGQIMVLKEGAPWADHLYTLEAAYAGMNPSADPASVQVLYVLFPESTEPDSKWRIRSVSLEDGGFINRKDLPDAWKGLRDDELSKVSGVDGCIFVHASGFIGGNKTFQGVLDMAKKAVEM